MWSAVVASMCLAYLVVLTTAIRRAGDRHLAFVVGALGLRYLLTAFPNLVGTPLPGGVTPIALSSLAVCALGLLVIDKRLLQLRALLPLYLFLAAVLLSGVANGKVGGTVTVLTKFVYLAVIQLSLLHALNQLGPRRVFGSVLLVFTLPLGLQAASIALGRDAQSFAGSVDDAVGELDPQEINFIGSYGHESGFSMILLAMMLCLAFWQSRRVVVFWGLVAACILGVLFANYRTTMLGVLPILLAIILVRYSGAFVARQRAFSMTLAFLVATVVGAVVIGSSDLASRFTDLIAIDLGSFSRSPNMLTTADRDLMSGRLYIWSQYLTAFRNADFGNQAIGFGPESWRGVFRLYAHNTFVSFLYEFGYLGMAAFLFYWGTNIAASLAIRDGLARLVVFAAYVGFTIMNLATMPIWQIEGLICLAILNGSLMHFGGRAASGRAGPKATARRQPPSGAGPHATMILDLGGSRDGGRG
ncbi:O-antigen ligase family protein [Limibaculum sp. M0105]|uniref:O-antigen ligase family protein n=1 Tax=Thermohalobaculum xanthum TaxID=2753746 RepID=A0A8J7SDB1_9RHOB|nr:O-antigen ligase family protein [Thermohalobaculum xanthum]MBK0398731.1 O-antigen ligase family protein [Thermohalobaculum xanthum]